MEPIDLAVHVIEQESDELWQKTFDPGSVVEYQRGNSIADALAHFVYYVESTRRPEDLDEFRKSWAMQIEKMNEKFTKFRSNKI
jgi:hypothetical protein